MSMILYLTVFSVVWGLFSITCMLSNRSSTELRTQPSLLVFIRDLEKEYFFMCVCIYFHVVIVGSFCLFAFLFVL